MIINQNKITNPFLEMFICPNCLKRHEMGTKLCSYECSKEYQEKLKKENEMEKDIKEQLGYLVDELSKYIVPIRTWSEENSREDYTALVNINNKIKDIIQDKEVYTTK